MQVDVRKGLSVIRTRCRLCLVRALFAYSMRTGLSPTASSGTKIEMRFIYEFGMLKSRHSSEKQWNTRNCALCRGNINRNKTAHVSRKLAMVTCLFSNVFRLFVTPSPPYEYVFFLHSYSLYFDLVLFNLHTFLEWSRCMCGTSVRYAYFTYEFDWKVDAFRVMKRKFMDNEQIQRDERNKNYCDSRIYGSCVYV